MSKISAFNYYNKLDILKWSMSVAANFANNAGLIGLYVAGSAVQHICISIKNTNLIKINTNLTN